MTWFCPTVRCLGRPVSTPSSPPISSPCGLFLLLASLFRLFTPALSGIEEVYTAIPVGASISFECYSETPAVWVKQSADLQRVDFLSHNGFPIDNSVNLNKFAFTKLANKYVLIVKNVVFADAGIYKCSNVMQAWLSVVAPPTCAPFQLSPVPENLDLSVSCQVHYAGPPPGWYL